MNKLKIKPQSACKRFIETMDMETGFIEEKFQDDIKPESDSYLRHDEDLEDLKKLLEEKNKK